MAAHKPTGLSKIKWKHQFDRPVLGAMAGIGSPVALAIYVLERRMKYDSYIFCSWIVEFPFITSYSLQHAINVFFLFAIDKYIQLQIFPQSMNYIGKYPQIHLFWPYERRQFITFGCSNRLQKIKSRYASPFATPVNWHYSDIIMSTMASQITSLRVVYSKFYSGADERKHQSFASLAFVMGIHRWPVNSPHNWPVTRKHVSIWLSLHEIWSSYILPGNDEFKCTALMYISWMKDPSEYIRKCD